MTELDEIKKAHDEVLLYIHEPINAERDGIELLNSLHRESRLMDMVDELQKEIAELKSKILPLLKDVMSGHRDEDAPEYNECEKEGEECAWCSEASEIIKRLRD